MYIYISRCMYRCMYVIHEGMLTYIYTYAMRYGTYVSVRTYKCCRRVVGRKQILCMAYSNDTNFA